jgi:hypothetical protein
MSKSHSHNPKSKGPLALVPSRASATLRLGGMEPSENMPAGEYFVSCQSATYERDSSRVILTFQVLDGPHTGTGLRQWITVPTIGTISPSSRYAKQIAVALGRPVNTADDLTNPSSIFLGQFFRAFVGFRKTAKPRGGVYSEDNAYKRKDSSDGLRVHELLRREEL